MEKKDFIHKTTVFITWDTLSKSCSNALSTILKRQISAYATSDEPHMREWFLLLGSESNLTKKEIQYVLDIVEADGYEYDANDFGSYPVTEITSSVAMKLLKVALNIEAEFSCPEDEGVWLFLKNDNRKKMRLMLEYPESDLELEIAEFTTTEGKSDIQKLIEDILMDIDQMEEDMDRLSRRDLLLELLENKLQTKIQTFEPDLTRKVV